MIRRRMEWKIRDRALTLGERTLVMGVLNVTPDSFSDGGQYYDPDAAVRHAVEMQEQGADLIDIGAESTRPGSDRVSEGEEIRRLVPVLKRLKGQLDIPLSVDTYKPKVAALALEHGVQIINDVSGLTWEPELATIVRDADAGFILNHMRGKPETWAKLAPLRNVMAEIGTELEAAVHRARDAGVDRERIVIDPGFGFGKRGEQNYELLARLEELERIGLPVLVGVSRKSFLAQPDDRATEFATAAAVAMAVLRGTHIVRVHDVAAMAAATRVADALVAAIPEEAVEERPARGPRQVDLDIREKRAPKPVRPPVAGARPGLGGPVKRREPEAGPRSGEPAESKGTGASDRGGDRPAYGGKGGERGNRPSYGGRGGGERGGGDRPSYGGRGGGERGGGDRPGYGGKGGGDRPSYGGKGSGRSGDRPGFGGKGGERGGNRPSYGGKGGGRSGDRPGYGGKGGERGGDRPGYGGKGGGRPGGRPGGGRPGGRSDGGPGGSRPGGGRPGGGRPGGRPSGGKPGGGSRGPKTPGGKPRGR